MQFENARVRRIWNQSSIPVLLRQGSPNPLLLRIPYADDNRNWIRAGHKKQPTWDRASQHWSMPIAWFDDLIQRALERYGQIYVIQLYKQQQKCASACWNAKGFHCECSCLGASHGTGQPGGIWFELSETFAFSWGPTEYACRLLVAKPRP